MEYDLTVTCMLSFGKDKHIKTAKHFAKQGLMNIKSRKILANILIDKKYEKEIKNIEFSYPYKIYFFDSDDLCKKIYSFYHYHGKSIAELADWHIQVDDDSITDVDGLLSDLNANYDPEIPIRFISGDLTDIHPEIDKILIEHNLKFSVNLDNKIRSDLWLHEWEFSCSSKGCLKRIFHHKNALDILYVISDYMIASDHGLTALAMICKIPVIPYRYAHFANLIKEFSLNGGKYYHIHYVDEGLIHKLNNNEAFVNESNIISPNILTENIFRIIHHNNFNEIPLCKNKESFTCSGRFFNKDGTFFARCLTFGSWEIVDSNVKIFDENKDLYCILSFDKFFFKTKRAITGQLNSPIHKHFVTFEIL